MTRALLCAVLLAPMASAHALSSKARDASREAFYRCE